ncbi:type 1 fimbrial protein [Providencia vermicola]|uniref:Type 1 fimbrial protein n=1 Tax=Providencia vermicola TaxID=333965 RepID=A0AAX3S2U3_9GAMM|nr:MULTISPECIES: type 1 fimbrial protein [Providencia]ELX8378476.1 type 1 fimbrial protein [Providencia stuartii]EMD5257683.1 type 1 fimbrial protein [Providencia stuartii]USB35512.1 type 1 fimbrial protein [Providencia vermicola]WFC08018.1 type 1 fimbrial protein [Providencia vermicola]
MNKLTKCITLFPLLVSGISYGDINANLKVNGDIKPPTCLVNGMEKTDIIYDMGKLSLDVIPVSDMYIFPSESLVKNTVTVTCDATTYLTFMANDTYQSLNLPATPLKSSYGHIYFRFNVGEPQALGGVYFLLEDLEVDNKAVYARRLYSNIKPTSGIRDNTLTKDEYYGWANVAKETVDTSEFQESLVPGKVFSVSFKQGGAFINSRTDLSKANINLNDGINYNAEAVVTFNFGI